MKYWKVRLFAFSLVVLSAGMIWYTWYQAANEGRYSIRVVAFAPLVFVGGIFLFLFPTKGGKLQTTKDKIIAFIIFGIGLVAGLVNWYLLDPGFFASFLGG
jgi:hypothetical protein